MSRKSGKVVGGENVVAFEQFIKERQKNGDWRPFILVGGRHLNKSAIVKSPECTFGKSVFIQNPQVKSRLARLEAELVAEGILAADDCISAGASRVIPSEALAILEKQILTIVNRMDDFRKFLYEFNAKAAEYEAEARIIVNVRGLHTKGKR